MSNLRGVFSQENTPEGCTENHKCSFFVFISGTNGVHEWLRMTNAFILCDLVGKVQKSHAANRECNLNIVDSFAVLIWDVYQNWKYYIYILFLGGTKIIYNDLSTLYRIFRETNAWILILQLHLHNSFRLKTNFWKCLNKFYLPLIHLNVLDAGFISFRIRFVGLLGLYASSLMFIGRSIC